MAASRARPGRIEAVLCDLDGTLVDTEPYHWRSTNVVLEPLGASLPWEDYQPMIGVGEVDYWKKLKARYGLAPPVEELSRGRSRAYVDLLSRERIGLLPGVAELVALLEERRTPRAIASSAPRVQLEASLRSAGLAEVFRVTRSGYDDVACAKPAPDVYLAAASALGVDPAACVALEDSPSGTEGGVAAGCFVIGVPSRPGNDLAAHGAHLVLPAMAEAVERLRGWLG
jgi:HAD superfamily hydrolase (TIGR01509 family)